MAAQWLGVEVRVDEGKLFAAMILQAIPNYRVGDFLSTFRFEAGAATLFRQAARRLGLDE
jgi:hypothetical protein